MEDRERDLQEFHANIDKKRLEIESEIEKQRQAVEAEIAAKRRAMEDQFMSQRAELDRRHAEQMKAINRQVNARDLMSRIEAEFNAGRINVEAGVAIDNSRPVISRDITADAEALMHRIVNQKMEAIQGKPLTPVTPEPPPEPEPEHKPADEFDAVSVDTERDFAQENAKVADQARGILTAVKGIFDRDSDEKIAADIAREDAKRKAIEERKAAEAEWKAAEAERKAMAEQRAKEEAEAKAKAEAERKAKEQAEAVAKAEAERKAKNELDLKTRVAAERKAQEENQRKENGGVPKRRVAWGRFFLLLLMLLLIAGLFFFGTIFTYKLWSQSGPPAVVYPRTTVVETDANGNAVNTQKIEPVLEERINVLVMGTDYGDSDAEKDEPKRTDAMLLVSFGPEDKKVAVLSLPRDTKVILPGHRDPQKLNAAYAFGGVMMAKQTVANLLGVPVTHYAIADWQAFIKVVDLIGGVDLLVEHDMKYDDPYADLHIDLKEGYQHLDGQKAGQYVRYRSDELGDIGRAQRQQKFLKAAASRMFDVSNVMKIPALISLVSECVQTDMNTMTMLKAMNSIKLFGDEKIKTGTLGGTFDEENDISYWVTDETAIRKVLKELEIPSSKLAE